MGTSCGPHGVFTSGGTLTFDGTVAQTFQVGGSTFLDLVINNTGAAAVTPNGALTIRNVTLTLGTLVMGANALNVSGDWVRTGGAGTSTGTVTFDGAAAQAFNPVGLDVPGPGDQQLGRGTVTASNTLTIRNLTLTLGTLAMGANALNVSGDWVRRVVRGPRRGR